MSDGGENTCPLCAEEMDLTDLQLKACKCGYEICVWCWHHIMDMAEKNESEGRCPACRSLYDKEKIVGVDAKCDRVVSEVNLERKKLQKAKPKSSDGRKQLSSVRVIQRNLVYIVGLPLSLADEELLQHKEYFGQYGKVLKVSVSRNAAGTIQQFPNNTCSVYVTYAKEEETVRCINSVHGFVLDGRALKACFGTTKYCHAWLRNMPCTNPDCLYLHEVGSQDDSFTKDEIIPAYTRVQQNSCTNTLRREGNVLPAPVDDYNNTTSAAKPIIRSGNNPTSTARNSSPNGVNCRSTGLPVAASWGLRAPNSPSAVGQAVSVIPTKQKSDRILTSSTLLSTTQNSTPSSLSQNDKVRTPEESQVMDCKGKTDPSKKLLIADELVTRKNPSSPDIDSLSPGVLSNKLSSTLSIKSRDLSAISFHGNSNSFINARNHGGSVRDGLTETVPIQDIDLKHSFVRGDMNSINGSSGFSNNNSDPQPVAENSCSSKVLPSGTDQSDCSLPPCDCRTTATDAELEEDLISFDKQRLKDPEFIARSCNTNSFSSKPSRSHSQQNGSCTTSIAKADSMYINGGAGDSISRCISGISTLPSGLSTSSGDYLFLQEQRFMEMNNPKADSCGKNIIEMGESSILSNILSLDMDSWDVSLANLLNESGKHSRATKLSNPSSQSKFSFARQDAPSQQSFGVDSLQFPNSRTFSQGYADDGVSYMDNYLSGRNFSSNFEESGAFTSHVSAFSPNNPSLSRCQVSAPPGFRVPNRVPPGFSSIGQNFEHPSGNHIRDTLPRNSYQAMSTSNVNDLRDIEFMDPAILAVGKGKLQGAMNSGVLDSRTTYPQQVSAYDDATALHLLMQSSLASQQSFRLPDDGFASVPDSYGVSPRSLDQSHLNLSPLPHLALHQSRNGNWNDWNEIQAGNNLSMAAELLRTERLGFNRFAGYEDGHFRLPSSANFYNSGFDV